MSVEGRSAGSRTFVASGPPLASVMGTTRSGMVVWVTMVAAAAVMTVGQARPWSLGVALAVVVVVPSAWFGFLWWRSRRPVVVHATSGGLTFAHRSGAVFSLADAQWGSWAKMGVALHLRAGSQRFVLGVRDRRIGPSTRLGAPPVSTVDAWLSDSEFDELLAMSGGRSGLDVLKPALGGPARCLLFPNPYLAEEFGPFAFRKHLRHMRSQDEPRVFLDIVGDTIRVIDPDGDAVIASASRAQVTATRAFFRPDGVISGDGNTYDYPAITGLFVCLPDVGALTIGCLDLVGIGFRFTWRGEVDMPKERPLYVVSGVDWLTLVERFDLMTHLDDGASD